MKKSFLITEAVLIVASAFFAFALVGYGTIALLLAASAVVVGLYRLIAVCCRKKAAVRRTLNVVLSVCIGLGLFTVALIEIPIISSARTDAEPGAPYLIVLGAGVNGEEPSLSLLNRLEAAKKYLDENPACRVVVSGAQGKGELITEAECMRRWLENSGIAADRIILEEHATSTYENVAYSLEIIRENGGKPGETVAIASSEYHLYRAKYIAAQLGAKPCGVAGHTSYPIIMINYFIREAAAVMVMWLS